MQSNILLTGRPRVGKSSLILRVVEKLRRRDYEKIGGFYTLETSHAGSRIGFDIHTLNGRIAPLARVGMESRFRLGKYGIDMEQFEAVALPALEKAIRQDNLVVIDEIGFMELKSHRFRVLVEEALSSRSVIATIMRNRYDFSDAVKGREDVQLFTVTVENRDRLVDEIVRLVLDTPPRVHDIKVRA